MKYPDPLLDAINALESAAWNISHSGHKAVDPKELYAMAAKVLEIKMMVHQELASLQSPTRE